MTAKERTKGNSDSEFFQNCPNFCRRRRPQILPHAQCWLLRNTICEILSSLLHLLLRPDIHSSNHHVFAQIWSPLLRPVQLQLFFLIRSIVTNIVGEFRLKALFQITILIALDPKSGRIYKSFMEEVKWWKSDSAGEEVERRIRRETLQLAILMTTNIVSSVVMSTAFVIPQKEDRNLFYEIALFEDFLPKWAGVLKAIYRTQAFFVRPFCVVAAFSQALYIFHNMRFQMYMILHFIKTINDNCENDQLIIKNRLLFCFKNYIQLSKALRRLLKLQWAVSLAYQIIIPPLIISTAVYGLLVTHYFLGAFFTFFFPVSGLLIPAKFSPIEHLDLCCFHAIFFVSTRTSHRRHGIDPTVVFS